METFKFSREWLRAEAARVTDPRSSNLGRRLNLPPSYVLIHRVSTEGIGVLCQLGSEGPFRAEMIQWMPGYVTRQRPAPGQAPARTAPAGGQPGLDEHRPGRPASRPRRTAGPAGPGRPPRAEPADTPR